MGAYIPSRRVRGSRGRALWSRDFPRLSQVYCHWPRGLNFRLRNRVRVFAPHGLQIGFKCFQDLICVTFRVGRVWSGQPIIYCTLHLIFTWKTGYRSAQSFPTHHVILHKTLKVTSGFEIKPFNSWLNGPKSLYCLGWNPIFYDEFVKLRKKRYIE